MKYYEISQDFDDDQAASIDIQHLREDGSWHDMWIYGRCQVADDVVPFQFLYEGGELRDFNLAVHNIPLISDRFRKMICPVVGNAVQFVRTSLAGETLFVLNVLQSCDALDLENSLVTRRNKASVAGEGDAITGVIKLRIDPSRASGRMIFRLEKWNIPIIVSEEIREIAMKEGASGAIFERVA